MVVLPRPVISWMYIRLSPAAAMTMDLYGHLVDASLWQAARLIGGTTGASERLQGRIRTESEPGRDAKNP